MTLDDLRAQGPWKRLIYLPPAMRHFVDWGLPAPERGALYARDRHPDLTDDEVAAEVADRLADAFLYAGVSYAERERAARSAAIATRSILDPVRGKVGPTP